MKLIALLFLMLTSAVVAQQPFLYFNTINTENGLSHNKVNCILQDKRGFMWFGTEDGLNRYDGHYFTIFRNRPGDTSSLSGNIITDLLEDKQGMLWIATSDGGLTRYNYRLAPGEQFKQFKHIEGDTNSIPVNTITKLLEDGQGYLWLATSGAYVLRFNSKTEKFEAPVRKGTRSAAALCLDANGVLWAGKIGGSILKINTRTLAYEMDERYNDLYAKLPHASVTSLYRDESNNIWFGSWDNVLYRYNNATRQEEVFKKSGTAFSFPDDEVTSFAAGKQKKLWMGGRYFGLTIFDRQENRFYNYRHNPSQEGSLADNHVNNVYADRQGLVWVGTNAGLSVYNPLQQPFVQTFLPGSEKGITIYDFYTDEKGTLYVGANNGIYTRPTGSDAFTLKQLSWKGQPLAVTKFYKDVDGSFYIGTDYSLFLYDIAANRLQLLPNTEKDPVMKKIIDSRVVSIMRDTVDGHPVLLVSPYGHYITYYDFVDKAWVSRTDSTKKIVTRFNLRDNLIRKFYRGSNGHRWITTVKYGLGDWQQRDVHRVNHLCNNPKQRSSISNDNVYDMLEDSTGNLWVSTYGGGLNHYNIQAGSFTHVNESVNLTEGIQTDGAGHVWIISNGNLHKYDPHAKAFSSYTLPDLEKTGGIKGYIYKDAQEHLYVAGNGYFIRFNPADVKDINRQPTVYFTDFRIFSNSASHLLQQDEIELQYFQNYFSIEFSAPDFTGSIQYSYMLEGADNNWTDAGNSHLVNYSNLPAGDYTFRVRASHKKEAQGSTSAFIKITITPPFWQRWWFYLLCAVAASSVIYVIYRYRINELLKRQAIRNRIAQDLHDSMGSTLSSISVYSQVAKIYQQQNRGEQLQQTLQKIGETSGEMISEMSDIVWAINPRNDHISTIIQRMESYARPLCTAKNIRFNFHYDEAVPNLNLEMMKRKNLYLVFKEAVNNALKYSNCSNIDVAIHLHNGHVEFTVKDDGQGFDMQTTQAAASKSLSGNGMKNMQVRAADMKASLAVTSAPGQGTEIRLHFLSH